MPYSKPLQFMVSGSVEIRCSASVTQKMIPMASRTTMTGAACTYITSAEFYLYSTELKAKIGKNWRTTFPIPKKKIPSDGSRPAVRFPNEQQIVTGIQRLIERNLGLCLQQEKELKHGMKKVTLNENELFVFWLAHYEEIAALDTSSRKDAGRQKAFAKLAREIGSFDLALFCKAENKERTAACGELASRIKRALGHSAETKTSNIKEKTQVVRYAVKLFLQQKGIDPGPILTELIRLTTPPKGVAAKIAEGMRPQTLSLESYRKLYSELASCVTDMHLGLLLMLFMGLTAEEACGINTEDISQITGFYDCYRVDINKQYNGRGKRFSLQELKSESAYRHVPIPYVIYNNFLKKASKDKGTPLLKGPSGARMTPVSLMKELNLLLKREEDPVKAEAGGKSTTINLAFNPSSYRISCRNFWQYQCGMSNGEINYLAGLATQETVFTNYVDFNNVNLQYRLYKQMEHGIALVARPPRIVKSLKGVTIKTKKRVDGSLDKRVCAEVHIQEPMTFVASSQRGIKVYKEEE